ncbi:MAG: SDR family NAD(P)-dependent oxidoreductase [Caulobacteraceae bacterium]|nr:SDR family NAD(P)-dependent oxidoreductase [Caulobacter sp.]
MAHRDAGIPDQVGRTAVVTGATGGLGFETARALLGAGAQVVIASRDPGKGAAALERLGAPARRVRFEPLDLADLASVRAFAERTEGDGPLDLLVANAGVMAPPQRRVTADGFERQMGVNHLGHFALAGLLLPRLRRGRDARLVAVSSLAHHAGRLDLADLKGEGRYSPFGAYAASKLANLLFVREFARRARAGDWGVVAVGAHPGFARTDIGRGRQGEAGSRMETAIAPVAKLLGQSAAEGARPLLHAATAPRVEPGAYFGPSGLAELTGPASAARLSWRARDDAAAGRLWRESERLTGVAY